ncbi:MAG: ABC transporter permease [Anaerolineae bacterium]
MTDEAKPVALVADAPHISRPSTRSLQVESPGRRAWRRFLRHRLAVISLGLLIAISVLAVGAPLFDRYPPNKIDLRAHSQAPSAAHWLGTDRLGRDIWSRTIHGGRVSLTVGLSAAFLSTLIGTVLGSLAGYYGRAVDMLIMRLTDVVMTFPSIVIMLTIAAFVGPGLWNVVLIIGALSWPGTARLVRGQFLSFREQDFVLAARCLGVRDRRIIAVHILPNVLAPLLAQVTFAVGMAILTEAGLSFLGLGVPLPTPSWGNMLEAARNLEVLQQGPWMWMPPALMTLLTVLCVNFIGDGLRDAIDPRLIL